jgi:hypothetical protein
MQSVSALPLHYYEVLLRCSAKKKSNREIYKNNISLGVIKKVFTKNERIFFSFDCFKSNYNGHGAKQMN